MKWENRSNMQENCRREYKASFVRKLSLMTTSDAQPSAPCPVFS